MRLWARALDLLYPTRCLVCDRDFPAADEPWLCAGCEGGILPLGEPACERCGQSLAGEGEACGTCRGRTLNFEWATAMGRYQGPLRQAVHRFKFLGMDLLARPFAAGMARAIALRAPGRTWDLVVPIPPSRLSRIFPGRNPAELLAQEISLRLGIRVGVETLRKLRETPAQSGLRREARLLGVAGTMQVLSSKRVTGKSILIVDDILTTGATCAEAARVLRLAGATTCHVVTVAR